MTKSALGIGHLVIDWSLGIGHWDFFMDISIIIVSYNVKDRLEECLRSVFANARNLNLEVFVVDNASADGSAAMVKNLFPQVKLIVNTENLGFAKANNQAAKQANGKYILLLNPDMRVLPDTLSGMIDFMDNHPEAGVGGCKLINEKGETVHSVRRFPKLSDQLAIFFKLPKIFKNITAKYLMNDFDYDKFEHVDSVRGSFFIIKREMLDKIGLLDEQFFIWFEEVDYCKRVIAASYKVAYNPSAQCVDYVGQSFKKQNLFWRQCQFFKSMFIYFWKWGLR